MKQIFDTGLNHFLVSIISSQIMSQIVANTSGLSGPFFLQMYTYRVALFFRCTDSSPPHVGARPLGKAV